MASQPQLQLEPVLVAPERLSWNLETRVAFRFCVVYFGLYCVATQIVGAMFPRVLRVAISTLLPVRLMVTWTTEHVFHVTTPLVYQGSGSGDKTYDWVLSFCVLVIAMAGAALWSLIDRKRENYSTAHKWFYLAMRFALASQMLTYGFAKIVPLQMPYPTLARLLEPFGNFSPMGVLWYSIGASPAYETFVGSAEALGGILLMLPRTAFLGALICLADMIEVFMLNMTYDVPVKLFSFHLILMSLVLLAPNASRLARFFFSQGTVEAPSRPALFKSPRANRIAVAAQVAYGLLLLGLNIYGSWNGWHSFGGGAPKPALYGIWNIDPAENRTAWKRVVFDGGAISFQQADNDAFSAAIATINAEKGSILLNPRQGNNMAGELKFQRPTKDELILDGTVAGKSVHLRARLMDRNSWLLVSRGFHWIQEYPFNR